jgi:hypothetical protein
MNPLSYVGNNISASYSDLQLRIPIGTDLVSMNHYLTQSLTSKQPNTLYTIFDDGTPLSASLIGFPNENTYEAYKLSSYRKPIIVNRNISDVGNSIRLDSIQLTGELKRTVSTNNINPKDTNKPGSTKLNISLKPSKPFNDDIINQLGSFDISNYIGDPTSVNKNEYDDLNEISNVYFDKFTSVYNINEYLRMVEFFDRGVFNTAKKAIPAKVKLLSGVTIEPHVLQRNKISSLRNVLLMIEELS